MKTPRFWQSRHLASTLLVPASLLYCFGAWVDRTFTRPRHAPLPVISIGNVTMGGAGKTPVTLALVSVVRAMGHTPHILTRGYKGARLSAHRVSTDDAAMVGDEALLLAKAAPTWVGRDRLASARAAVQNGATILLCDDALHHHRLHKNISLLVIDGPYGAGNGRVFPAGPLREPLGCAFRRCDAVVMIGPDAQHCAAAFSLPVFTAALEPDGDPEEFQTGRWLAFAGIGRPEKFYATLRGLGANLVATRDFPDHHPYRVTDLGQLKKYAAELEASLVTTQKDAVKLPAASGADIRVLSVRLAFENPAAIRDFLASRLPPAAS